jgi:hypothetical protein
MKKIFFKYMDFALYGAEFLEEGNALRCKKNSEILFECLIDVNLLSTNLNILTIDEKFYYKIKTMLGIGRVKIFNYFTEYLVDVLGFEYVKNVYIDWFLIKKLQ